MMESKNIVDTTDEGSTILTDQDKRILSECELRKLSREYHSIIPHDDTNLEESELV